MKFWCNESAFHDEQTNLHPQYMYVCVCVLPFRKGSAMLFVEQFFFFVPFPEHCSHSFFHVTQNMSAHHLSSMFISFFFF